MLHVIAIKRYKTINKDNLLILSTMWVYNTIAYGRMYKLQCTGNSHNVLRSN